MSNEKVTDLVPKTGVFAKACVTARLNLEELASKAPEHLVLASLHEIGVIASMILRMQRELQVLSDVVYQQLRRSNLKLVGDQHTVHAMRRRSRKEPRTKGR